MGVFRDSLKKLYDGVMFSIPNCSDLLKVRGIVMCGTCDLPAKAQFLNMEQYNGDYGCHNCKQKGERFDNVHIYPFVEKIDMRTTKESMKFAKEASAKQKDVFVYKKKYKKIAYNYIETTAIDVMHCVYVGLTKKLGWLGFDSENHDQPFSMTKFLSMINKRLLSICPLNSIVRLPRSISEISYWKASELKLFLLVYSLPILSDIMNPIYLNHHKLLVFGIYLLNQNSVSNDMIEQASLLLREYVLQFSTLYGLRHMSCNLHLIQHLPEIVKRFGPLWVTSCNAFENMNGVLKSLVHETKYAEIQIHSSLSLFLNQSEIKRKYLISGTPVESFCKLLESKARLKLQPIDENLSIIGKIKKSNHLPPFVMYCFRNIQLKENKVHIFYKLYKNKWIIDSEFYNRSRKTKSHVIKYLFAGQLQIEAAQVFIKNCECMCDKNCNECDINVCKIYAVVNR